MPSTDRQAYNREFKMPLKIETVIQLLQKTHLEMVAALKEMLIKSYFCAIKIILYSILFG